MELQLQSSRYVNLKFLVYEVSTGTINRENEMFKWPMLAVAAVAMAFHPAEGTAQQEIETILAIPSQTTTFHGALCRT